MLRGNYVNVRNDTASRASSSNHEFFYNQTSTHFDEVNVYYHVDTYRATYIDNLGFNKDVGSGQDLKALVNWAGDPVDARYFFNDKEVRFGYQVPFARQDEVIYHEYIHAMADAENGSHRLDPEPDEEGAIGEGISDYFAGSYTGDAQIGNCIFIEPRDMDNPDIASYDDYEYERDNLQLIGEVDRHRGGELFSAVLWDLRNSASLSAHDTDILVFEAISRLSGSPNFIEFRNAMMAEDSNINDGVNNDFIQNTFADWGIGSYVPPSVTIHGESGMIEGESQTFTTTVTSGKPPYSYQWYYKHEYDANYTLAVGETSSSYNHTAGSPPGEDIKVVVMDDRSSFGEFVKTIFIVGAN